MDPESGRSAISGSPESRASVNTSNATLSNGGSSRQRAPRSLPPWIESFESESGPLSEDQMHLLNPPKRTVLPKHNHSPTELERRVSKDGFVDWAADPLQDKRTPPQKRMTLQHLIMRGRGQQGRKWDHLRTAEPVIVAAYAHGPQAPPTATAWRHFLQSSVYGHAEGEESEVVEPAVLDQLQPGFNRPCEKPLHPLDPKSTRQKRRRTLWERLWRIILRHPLIPLVFRLVVMITSLFSLAIAAAIHKHEESRNDNSAERTQSVVAIAIDVVAVPYIGYMLWDEYTGKPLGLRPTNQKIALILLDLFFIIFKSASTALAFESLVYHNNRGERAVTKLSSALAAFMFVGLLAWTMNFMVSIFRTVARLSSSEEGDHGRQ
ncbi:hypothetical protein F5X68DRAFT_261251 [Plectosphaerella plurivora]|uniref:Regulator of phospholipase D SRF1 n=1 Tax=Plectosphaerella plurivora TaxID=936078 RepID=A0A9P9AD57_9PEZI|nr:hypothetical protein F5X68DRAFT_261251 [Plectosphaerella plurivora]